VRRALLPVCVVLAGCGGADGGGSVAFEQDSKAVGRTLEHRVLVPYGADPDRVAIGGISMGGFGALHLAAAFPDRFCAVGAHSPAIFPSGALSAPGAFDDAEDFNRHDLLKRARDIPPGTWVDVGNDDSFAAATKQLVERMRAPRYHPWPGGHDSGYWDAHMDDYVRFYVRELTRCRR
jgi:S-formylglutathione hydrolase FrmB